MRRKVAFILAVILSVSLAACGADNSASPTGTDVPADSQTEAPVNNQTNESATEENDISVSEEPQGLAEGMEHVPADSGSI